jgi:acyl-CoA hydrolase
VTLGGSSWGIAADVFKGDGPIYVAGACGEPTAFLNALESDPELAKGRTFTGVWIPGVNRRDPTSAHADRTALSIFATPELLDSIDAKRTEIVPIHYSTAYSWLKGPASLAGGVVQVPPPEHGTIGLGVASDFTSAVMASGAPMVAEINPSMPNVMNGPRYPIDRFAALIQSNTPLLTYDAGRVGDIFHRIGGHIANLISDGDHIQLGLGKLQTAVLEALFAHRGLRLHGGMISGGFLDGLEKGTFSEATTGVALGDADFYQSVATDPRIRFRDVSFTHSAAILGALPSFVSVNSILEVDLFGQGNGEFIGQQQITGHGGLIDFIRGSKASKGGSSILALPSTTGGGKRSRIVLNFAPGTPVTIPRSDPDWIVTEHGAAQIRFATVDERAERLICIAAPQHREALERAWRDRFNRGKSP